MARAQRTHDPRALPAIQAIEREGRCDISAHALAEAAEDGLHPLDLESALLAGKRVRVEKGDARGRKFVVVGPAIDPARRVGVVVRFKSRDRCVIITGYAVEEQDH